MTRREWIDLTVPVRSGMISWPSDPLVEVSSHKEIAEGVSSNVSLLKFGSHTGTHIDAPRHFLENGITVDLMKTADMLGPARVLSMGAKMRIDADGLKRLSIRRGQRLILKTRNSRTRWWEEPFRKDFVHLSLDAAKFLASRRVKMVGIDYLSVGGYKAGDGADVHRVLLSAGICILEGLDLSLVCPGQYDVLCLPLKIRCGDGAPARVLLRPRMNGYRKGQG